MCRSLVQMVDLVAWTMASGIAQHRNRARLSPDIAGAVWATLICSFQSWSAHTIFI
ncbi:MAG: hypothetical protein ACLRXC_12525 [[Clostridium] leptum]